MSALRGHTTKECTGTNSLVAKEYVEGLQQQRQVTHLFFLRSPQHKEEDDLLSVSGHQRHALGHISTPCFPE